MKCRICKKINLKRIISFGSFPVCHKYKNKNEQDRKFRLEIGICKKCDLVQLNKLFPVKELKPKYNWINYNEPEEHLDELVNKLKSLKNIKKNSIIAGVSYKEISTLKRFNRAGFNKTWHLNMKKDLDISDPKSNLETIQEKISKLSKKNIVKIKKKKADILIARHILEHSYDTINFIKSLNKMVKKNGYLVFEVPDCKDSLDSRDYASIWEEHILYFTENTLKRLFVNMNFKILYFKKYEYSYENVLILIVQFDEKLEKKNITLKKTKINFNLARLNKDKKKIKNLINKFKLNDYKICLFGTGHAACTFLNILKLHDLIDLVIDDDRNKQDLILPNSNLKIIDSNQINKMSKILIILGVNSESEKKIILKLKKKLKKEIKFFSIYNKSKYTFSKT